MNSREYAAAAAGVSSEAATAETQQQQQQQQQDVALGMLSQQLKRSLSDPNSLSVLCSGDSHGSNTAGSHSSGKDRRQPSKQQKGTAAAAAAAAAAAPPLSLEVPTVALRRCMLQTSSEKFGVNFGRSEVHVEVRSIGLYRFKGVHEPVHMVAVSTQRLAGRWFPEAAPSSKVG
jgi:hypothetical protein